MQRHWTSLPGAVAEARERRLDVALVGLGAAAGLSIRALCDRADVRVVAAVDPCGRRSPDLPLEAIVVEAIADLPVADLVIVATPTPTHVEVCLELLQQPRPPATLLCEKPVALDPRDVARLGDIAASRNVDFRAMLHYAFAPEVLWLADRIDALGPVESADCWFEDPYRKEVEARASVLCSSWVDSGINALSVLDRLVRLERVEEGSSTEVASSRILVRFASGDEVGSASIVTRWGDRDTVKRTTLHLRDGCAVELDHDNGTCSLDGVVAFCGSGPARQARYDSMLGAHLSGSATVHPTARSLALHEILDQGCRASPGLGQ